MSVRKLSPPSLSDNELYIKLQKYGIDAGPVTPTTKIVLERKLNKIQCQAEFKSDQTIDSTMDFNSNSKNDINESPVAKCEQNNVDYAENNKNNNSSSSLYYGISLLPGTSCNGEEPPFVFTDKKDALKIIKKYKGSRFKAFTSKEAAMNFASRPCDDTTSSPFLVPPSDSILEKQITNGLMIEKPSPFKAPKSQEMARLRKAIESGDAEYFKKTVWSNPRYLVSNGDTPTIFKEGFRYNAMHVAASNKQAAICQLILTIIEDSKFMRLLYPDDTEAIHNQRISYMSDLYLNMPEKRLCETPLHFASKFGCLKTVEVLLAHPLCDKYRRNIDKKKAKEIICERNPGASNEYKKQIELLFEERYYVPVLRSDDNSLQPIIGKPLSPDTSQREIQDRCPEKFQKPSMSIKAVAGPMSPQQAKVFYKKWKTPPRSVAKDLYKIRLGDTEKGLEVVGRELAKESKVPWKEFWPFLDCWCDLSLPEGLLKLENHLKIKRTNIDSQEDNIQQGNGEFSFSKVNSPENGLNRSKLQTISQRSEDLKCPVSDCTSPLSHLCHLLEEISLNRNSSEMIINGSCSYQKMPQKHKEKNHLSGVSRVLQFEDCCENKKNSLFQTIHLSAEIDAKSKVLETNCNSQIGDQWTLNSVMDAYTSKALSLLIQKVSANLIDIVLEDNSPQKILVNKDLVDSILPHIQCFYQTASNYDINTNLKRIHCDIAKQIATNFQHNLIQQEVEQIHRYLKNYLSIVYDLSSSEDECHDCHRNWNYKKQGRRTIYKKHLRCLFQFLCKYLSESISPEDWKEVQNCGCEWKLKINSNNNLSTDLNFYILKDNVSNNNEPKDCVPASQHEETDDSSDEEFYTPPSSLPSRNSPVGTATPDEGLVAFIQGQYPSKLDIDVVRALGNTKIDPILYPYIFQWKHTINSFPSDIVENLCSPAHKRKVLKQDNFSINTSYSMTPIARSSFGCVKTTICMPKNLYETSLSWEESSGE